MFAALTDWFDRLLAPVPGLLLISAGMLMVGAAVLMPSWLETRELTWKRELMKMQSEKLEQQANNYRDFNKALATDDPVLLERLAFYHLHLKPVGATPLVSQPRATNASIRGRQTTAVPVWQAKIPTIEQMLHQPLPQPGVNTPVYQPIKTRLVTLTTGPMRFVVILAGLACLGAGLIAPNPRKEIHKRHALELPNSDFVPAVLDDDDFSHAMP
ncbi:MAG: hypothetical protein IT444_04130 [Phycisphaeraceae bacterium]|nr:hypothetical protein [Phycisphaeraceae bacterium]